MSGRRRRPTGPGFGEDGGSDVAAYITASGRAREAERQVEAGERIVRVRVDQVDRSPYQVRVNIDSGELRALTRDVKEHGLNQPITLRAKPDGRYELIAGERRWLAAKDAGLETVEARIRELGDFDAHLVGISENNQRADLSPWEKAIEALRLRDHAAGIDRPHAQRDLARYLNRNVAIVNQQLAIARTITTNLIGRANLSHRDVCALPHETLHRIAKLKPDRRGAALEEAVRALQNPKTTARVTPASEERRAPSANGTGEDGSEPTDRWTRLWEHGGFQVSIRKPLRDIDPGRAQKYIQALLPGIGGLAARAADEDTVGPLIEWEHEHGRLLFVGATKDLQPETRSAARKVLTRMLNELDVPP